ncbi:MAG: high-affinity iron transporter [Anaerolineaceae bacterium]|nr:MAG: high-affinity iron transporter [Anaerolineaceae bacterium]
MLSSYILSLREGLEAALILGIVLGALRQMRRRDLIASVWLGAGSAALVSLAAAVLLTRLGLELKDPAEAIFEGLTMLLAAGILTWMIFWMARQSRNLKADLEFGVRRAMQGGRWSLFGLAFIAVLREGVELALFLTAAAFSSDARQAIVGAALGLGTAALLGWLLFAASVRLDLRRFFQVTGFLLILFAAGLAAHGVGELVEVGWLPSIVAHVWDVNPILDENSAFGQILKSLLGYNGNPSLTEVLAYLGYFGAVLLGLRRAGRRRRPEPVEGSAAAAQAQD